LRRLARPKSGQRNSGPRELPEGVDTITYPPTSGCLTVSEQREHGDPVDETVAIADDINTDSTVM